MTRAYSTVLPVLTSLLVGFPVAASACSLCVDAGLMVTYPGVVDSGPIVFLCLLTLLMFGLVGRLGSWSWRLRSRRDLGTLLVAMLGAFVAGNTGVTLAGGSLLLVIAFLRLRWAYGRADRSALENLGLLLSLLAVIAIPTVVVSGNQKAKDVDYLFSKLWAPNSVVVDQAGEVLAGRADVGEVACSRIEELRSAAIQRRSWEGRAWYWTMQWAHQSGACPDQVDYLAELCGFSRELRGEVPPDLTCAADGAVP